MTIEPICHNAGAAAWFLRVDHREHERTDAEAIEAAAELPKLLADLIRCTAKMAETEGINLSRAYVGRAAQLAARWGH